MRIEHHGKRFAAPLRVPKYTAFSVRLCSNLGLLNCLAYRKILMISRQYFNLIMLVPRKTDKVLQDIQKTLFRKHPLIESFKLCKLIVLV